MYETAIIVFKCYGYVTTIYTIYHIYSYTQFFVNKTSDISKSIYSFVTNKKVKQPPKHIRMEEEVWVKLNFIEI